MPFAFTNSFTADTKAYSSEANKNFSEAAVELNALPTSGAWKGNNIVTTAVIKNYSLGGSVFASNFQFDQTPKGPTGVDPTHSDHFVPKRFADTTHAALLLPSLESMDLGTDRILDHSSYPLEEYSETFVFGNKWIIETGLKLSVASQSTSNVFMVDLLSGFSKILYANAWPLQKTISGSKGQSGVSVGAANQIIFNVGSSTDTQDEYHGITYIVMGC